MKFLHLPVILLLALLSFGSVAQILESADEAFRRSEESQKPVLLVFSGSDWCAPCIRFSNNVLTKESFSAFAGNHLIILKADFPQRRKLPKELKDQNNRLADQYNPGGQFPYILLLKPDKTLLSTIPYRNQSAEEFISQISTHFSE